MSRKVWTFTPHLGGKRSRRIPRPRSESASLTMPKRITPVNIHDWISNSGEPFVTSTLIESPMLQKASHLNGRMKPVKNTLTVSEKLPPIYAESGISTSTDGVWPFTRIATKNMSLVISPLAIGSALQKKLLILAPFICSGKIFCR